MWFLRECELGITLQVVSQVVLECNDDRQCSQSIEIFKENFCSYD
ncbi:hypothetical protein ES703_08082 [subsurface metagenome]